MARLRIGTCHWKYPSWQHLVYSQAKGINYLEEYAQKYNTVEIDQWFWSLFKENQAVLPDLNTVREYADSVPQDFIFTVKVPNSITLTHYYKKNKTDPLIRNPHFLSVDLFNEFLNRIEPLHDRLGPLLLQFEYLNKLKMPDLTSFITVMKNFIKYIAKDFTYGIEIRNPNYLQPAYFNFLQTQNICCVFLQGYFMPDIVPLYRKFKDYIEKRAVIRLHGPHKGKIEKQANKRWDKIIIARDQELGQVTDMVTHMLGRGIDVFLNVNNNYEGSSPLTIQRIQKLLSGPTT